MPPREGRGPKTEKTTKQRALEMLDRRDYSRAELIKKLTEKGESPEAAEEAVSYLASLGFVDDARYASLVVRQYAGKGYGARRVRMELMRRGLSREVIDDALGEMPEQDDTLDRLLAQKLRGSFDRADVKKATDALVRKGYGYDEISSALHRLRDSLDAEEYE